MVGVWYSVVYMEKLRKYTYIRMMYNPVTGNYDWRIECQWPDGKITPKMLNTGWHKGKPTISDTWDVSFAETRIRDYTHN